MENNPTEIKTGSSGSKVLLAIIAVAIIGIAVILAPKIMKGQNNQNTSPQITSTQTTNTVSESKAVQKYKDGTYDETGNYVSPAGDEQIGVEVQISDGIIKDAKVKVMATKAKSLDFQKKFVSGFKDIVVGKSIDELSLTAISGSSLTPKGFMDAIDKIKKQATASKKVQL